MKAFILMRKDISFCFSWILVAVILTIIAPIYFIYMTDINRILFEPVCLLSPLLGCNIVLSRICYIEDNYGTRKFLSTLPITRSQKILSRYFVGFVFIVFFMLVAVCNAIIVLDVSLHAKFLLIAMSVGHIFEGLYLLFYYRWGVAVAQYAFLGTIGMFAVIYYIFDKINIPLLNITVNIATGTILFLVSVVIYVISAFLSCIYEKNI